MKTPCEAFEAALVEEDAAALDALAPHVETCDSCRAKAALWKRVGETAPSLKREWESPHLLPRIRAAAEAARRPRRSMWLPIGIAAGIAAYAVATWISMQNPVPYRPDVGLLENEKERLLPDDTLKDVEKKEAAFVASIDALERRASPAPGRAASPLTVSLEEKLVLLDAAIADCRREIGRNELNTNLRRELLAMYHEKKKTLQDIVRDVKDVKDVNDVNDETQKNGDGKS
jgi:hypothetical protein